MKLNLQLRYATFALSGNSIGPKDALSEQYTLQIHKVPITPKELHRHQRAEGKTAC
jgi:hypothetical protein